jgi:hypothetical protein
MFLKKKKCCPHAQAVYLFGECSQICGMKKQSLQARVEDLIHLEDHQVLIVRFVRKAEERRNTKVFCW